jgi:predicted Rdx family selenoprotein
VRVTDELMSNYQHMVSEISLVPGGGGVFDVVVEQDGQRDTIYSKHETGRHAHAGEVVAALESKLPAGTLRYGS